MNILIIHYGEIDSNGGIHATHLAEQLVKLGHACTIAAPENKIRGTETSFATISHADAAGGNFNFTKGSLPDFIVTWTPREHVRKTVVEVLKRGTIPYIVYLEDNESQLVADALQVSLNELATMSSAELNARLPPIMTNPPEAREFMNKAAGIAVIIDRLRETAPANLPYTVLTPGIDPIFTQPNHDRELGMKVFGLDKNTTVIVYAGNVHSSNAKEVGSLYRAVSILVAMGIDVRLIRTGLDYAPMLTESEAREITPFVIDLGLVPRGQLPRLYDLATIFVQPGEPGHFNDFRLPSKLPEFFAAGKPVILPATNVGLLIKDGIEGVLLKDGTPEAIAEAVAELAKDPERAIKIGEAGASFAARHFSWSATAKTLSDFLHRLQPTLKNTE